MNVSNMIGKSGREVPNQFVICDGDTTYFQSYRTIIVKKCYENGMLVIYLDKNAYNYSRTTAKYRNMFLNCTTKELEEGIVSGKYRLANLNR